jgi:RNA polymerase-binding transcription factor DksA
VIDLLSQAEADVEALDHALARLEGDAYGACTGCGRPIPADRLAAHPTALTCVACAQAGTSATSVRRKPRS